MSLVVRRASAEEIFPLRHAVLRPGRPVTASVYREDPGAVHVAAWDGAADGELLVGCCTVFPEPWPGAAGCGPEPAAWRLRGMAVDPSRQRTGIGRQVLEVALHAAREAGAPLMWANARVGALPFYAAEGWLVLGEEFVTPDTGVPHRQIVRLLSTRPSTAAPRRAGGGPA